MDSSQSHTNNCRTLRKYFLRENISLTDSKGASKLSCNSSNRNKSLMKTEKQHLLILSLSVSNPPLFPHHTPLLHSSISTPCPPLLPNHVALLPLYFHTTFLSCRSPILPTMRSFHRRRVKWRYCRGLRHLGCRRRQPLLPLDPRNPHRS